MALTLRELQQFYNDCDPDEPLEAHDRRNVNIDALQPGEDPVRGANWVNRLARDIELSRTPVFRLFSGLRGAGKSTELRRLVERLEREDEKSANLLAVLIDAEEVLDIRSSIDIPDLLLALLYATDRRISELEKRSPEDAMKDSPLTRLWAWLSRTDIELSKAELGVTKDNVTTKLIAELKTRPTVRDRVRNAVATHLTSFLNDAHVEFQKLERRAKALGRSGLVIILDSLEKLQGTSVSFDPVLSSAEKVFASGAPYLKLPVHVLYTVPPALLLRMPATEVRFLPMIKLRTKDRAPFAEGFEAARTILRQRVEDEALVEVFGASLVDTRVREIIDWSGGYPRELVRLLQAVLTADSFPISERDFHGVLRQAGDSYRRVVLGNGTPALDFVAKIYVTQKLAIEDGERELADRLLSGNIVLRYLNDEEWADIHPALLKEPLLQDAILRYQRNEALRRNPPSALPVAAPP